MLHSLPIRLISTGKAPYNALKYLPQVKARRRSGLFMVGLSADNAEAPVNLFQQNHSHKLMWKGHIRNADGKVRPLPDGIMQPDRAADNKGDMAFPLYAKPLQSAGKSHGIKLTPCNFQSDYIGVLRYFPKYPVSLLFPDGILLDRGSAVRRPFIRYLADFQSAIAAETFPVFGYRVPEKSFLYLSHADYGYFHSILFLEKLRIKFIDQAVQKTFVQIDKCAGDFLLHIIRTLKITLL